MSTRTFTLAVTGFAIIVAACSSYGTSVVEVNKTQLPVASVTVAVPPSLITGQTARATATPKDANGTVLPGRPVVWFSSSASIASVSDSGVISAVAPGSAVVSAVSEGVAGQATMAVVPPAPTPVATLTVAVTPSAVLVGQTARATATLQDSSGNQLSGRTVTWETSDINIATVNTTGDVKAVGPGSAMIKASSEGKTNSSRLSVSAPAPIPVASVSVSPASASLQVGASAQLSAITRDANNNVLAGRLISWSSGNTGIATVSGSGLVTAVAAGSVSITASSEGQTASAAITVAAPAAVPVASVSVSPATSTLQVGGTVQLSAVTRDANNNVLTGRAVTWLSSNTNVASVNSTSGSVVAVGAGSATITATSETKAGTATITVSAPAPVPVASVTVSPATASLQVGGTVQFSAVTRDANNNVLTGRVVTWLSTNTSVASVNSSTGMGTAVGAGTTQIRATSEGQSGSSTFDVQAAPPPPPPGSSNEPSGMTLISERPFNALNETASWDTDNTLSIVQDATAPMSPSSVLRHTFPAGFAAGESNGHAGIQWSPSYRVLYIKYWTKYSANFQGQQTFSKQIYAWVNGSYPPIFFGALGEGSNPLTPEPVLQRMIVGDGFKSPNLVPGARFTRGQWDLVEIVLVGNSAGTANGSVDWYLNGVHIGSISGLQFASGAANWNIFEFNPVWGGLGGPNVTNDMYIQWDHVYLSGKN